ncbi:zinc-finger domain-containing protein [Herminiimonas sp. CN]|uniref:zinc-finger domain-containing protein n=1 Tax=Herminiimonas sp. CN TaxID=1349818 RepID=UPI000473988E|nr:zinc-finger domain-containing protein [Herminiimonas sp. CN]
MQATKATNPAKVGAIVELDGNDLPAHCPNVAMPLWSSHPRIFLDLSHGGSATCPYCGTVYRLKPGAVIKGH